MSNATIVQRMREACDQYEAGELTPLMAGSQIAALAEALEGVGREVAEACREFELRMAVVQDSLNYGEVAAAHADGQGVAADIRAWLEALGGL
jgi:hypothetical protein